MQTPELLVPDFPGQQPGVVVPAVFAEAEDDGQVVVLVLVVLREAGELVGEHGQPLAVGEHAHRHQLRKQAQVHAQLAGVQQLKSSVRDFHDVVTKQRSKLFDSEHVANGLSTQVPPRRWNKNSCSD